MLKSTLIVSGVALVLAACEPGATAAPEPLDAGAPARLAQTVTADGLVRTTWPSAEDPGPPYYSRIEPTIPHGYVAAGWAVIQFYRDPACVRPNFNLIGLFDPPAAFGCRLTVAGFNLWQGAPFTAPPVMAESQGLGAVPFWFVPAAAFEAAAQDGMLTIAELAALPGRLVGQATQFQELLQPFPSPIGTGGHPNPKLIQDAQGTLEDGRTFRYHLMALNGAVVEIELLFQ